MSYWLFFVIGVIGWSHFAQRRSVNLFVPAHCNATAGNSIAPVMFVRTHKTGSSTIVGILHQLSDVYCVPIFVVCTKSADFFTRTWNLALSADRERFQGVGVQRKALMIFA